MELFEILCGIAVVIITFYYYLMANFDFWKSRGIRGPRPIPIFGNFKDTIFIKLSMSDFLTQVYNTYKDESMIGVFLNNTPILLLKNLDLIKNVLIKDFSVFANRGLPSFKKTEPLSQHLFTLESTKWRPLRIKLSPVFTSGKLKEMFSLMSECADHLVQYMEKIASKNEPVECHELTAKYTTDVIGNCIFGIEMNALSNDDNEFRKMGRKIFAPSLINVSRRRIRQLFPWLYGMLGYIIPHSEIIKFFTRIVAETIGYREKNNVTRNDFIDVLRELKKLKKLDALDFTDSIIASQGFVFFNAGFETSSTTITHALYELALNQEIQDKLREEIDEVYAKCADIKYDNIKNMEYLDKVFKETLRKYPPISFLMRETLSSYTFDGTKVNIPKGQKVWIPTYAIHRDPDIYPQPDIFDPERFNEETVRSRHPMVYLPFGDGPRNCIGARFAIYQSKIGLVKMLQNYKVETCEKTPIPYISDPKQVLLASKGGIHLKIIKINRP